MARIEVEFVEGELGPASSGEEAWSDGAIGAWVTFEGVVRSLEGGRKLAALVYEAYQPMAGKEMRKLAEGAAERFGLLSVRVEHSVGRVRVGRVSFRMTVGSAHRQAALDAMGWFIDRMKQDVPLWKNSEWTAGS